MIRLSNLSHAFLRGTQKVHALRDITLNIDYGEVIAINGPSGSGKSTLLNVIGCILTPDSGEVRIMGENVLVLHDARRAKLRRKQIGFIFQSFNLIPVLNVYENIEYPLLLNRVETNTRKDTIHSLLERVGLQKYKKHLPDQLSGGQRQRVAIARALVVNPKFVLADEPTANLDSQTAMEIIHLMADLNKELSTAFVFSTHDIKISLFATRRLVMEDGKIIQ